MKHYSLNRLLALIAATGFAFLFADTLLEHWDILRQEPMAWISVIFSAVGCGVGAIAVLRWTDRSVRLLHLTLLASLLVGIAGFYFHIGGDEDAERRTAAGQEHESNEKPKPLLAPFAFDGLAVIGLLGTARKWPAEVKESLRRT